MQIADITIRTTLDYDDLPYTYRGDVIELPKTNEIALFTNRDKKEYFNPQMAMAHALKYLYQATKYDSERAKELVLVYSDALIAHAEFKDGMIFLPYEFDYALHANPDNMMKAGWYSGMAQGMALSFYSRINEMKIADCLFNTFISHKITHFDEDGYYWIDEYPYDPPNLTLNGFIYAIYGLYDYYLKTKKPYALSLLLGALTTVKKYANEYRVPGQVSIYCLAHRVPCDKCGAKYHRTHIKQFNMLYKMTNDLFFKEFADILLNDFKPEGKIGSW